MFKSHLIRIKTQSPNKQHRVGTYGAPDYNTNVLVAKTGNPH
jgi:hypothetical protein